MWYISQKAPSWQPDHQSEFSQENTRPWENHFRTHPPSGSLSPFLLLSKSFKLFATSIKLLSKRPHREQTKDSRLHPVERRNRHPQTPGAKFSISPGSEARPPRGCTVALAARKVSTTNSAFPAHCCPRSGSGAAGLAPHQEGKPPCL